MNVYYLLLYPLDTFIKNTIWWGLWSVLYFQFFWFSSSLPLEFLFKFGSLVYKNVLPKTAVLFLFSFFHSPSSYYRNQLCYREQKKRLQIWIFFPLLFILSQIEFALREWKKMFASKAYTFCKQTTGEGDWSYSMAASKPLLKLTLFPGLKLQYGATNCLAVYLIIVILSSKRTWMLFSLFSWHKCFQKIWEIIWFIKYCYLLLDCKHQSMP